MKIKICILLIAVQSVAIAATMKPLRMGKVLTSGGKAPGNYVVVQTTIQKNPNENDSTPIITRSVLGKVPAATNALLKVPEKLTDLQAETGVNVTQMSGLISQSLGTLGAAVPDPKVQAGLVAASLITETLGVITDQGLKIAGKLMDKFYGKDPTLLNLIEILPADYY